MNLKPGSPFFICLLGLFSFTIQAQQFVTSNPPVPRMIITNGGGGWKEGQVDEPCILVNPKDHTKLIMFYGGMEPGGYVSSIGKAWANVNEPLTWHEDASNPLLRGDPGIAFEGGGIRLDTVVYQAALDEYWIYYTGTNPRTMEDAIGLATCPAGPDGYREVAGNRIKRHENNPILSPRGQGRDDETHVSQGAVFREKGLWYSLYSYRTVKQVLPGIRLATSPDGKQWIKVPGPDLLTAAPESRFIEWHQVFKIADRYVMVYEGYNGGTRWGADVATSSHLTTGWRKAPVKLIDQTRWPNYSDKTMFHVATPALYRLNHKWLLYFIAAPSGSYTIQRWTLWGMECNDLLQHVFAIP
jgi:hypothetical protein